MTQTGRRTYRLVLRLLPLRFRKLYGADMEDLFDEVLEANRRRGRLAWLLAWIRGTADVIALAARIRWGGARTAAVRPSITCTRWSGRPISSRLSQ